MSFARNHLNSEDFIGSGTYESVVEFSKRYDHGGLYLVKIDVRSNPAYRFYLFLLTGPADKKNKAFSRDYRGVHISDIPFEALNDHSVIGDGAIAVNRDGYVMDDHRLGRLLFPELVCREARSGAGHTSMATLSLFPGVSTYVSSHERKTVIKFKHGKIRKMWDGTQTIRPTV